MIDKAAVQEAMREGGEQREKLELIARDLVRTGRRMQRALERNDEDTIVDALYYARGYGNTAKSWIGNR